MASREPAAWPPLIAALKNPELQGLASLEIAKIGVLMVPLLMKALHGIATSSGRERKS
jgi:hypothetical protein